MQLDRIDGGLEFDWGKTSRDYAAFRHGYPESFYELLSALGVGRPGQRILDLGTGTGVLARAFARRGAVVTGVDAAAEQIAAARRLAAESGLQIDYQVLRVEELDWLADSFDVASAGQAWLYFDAAALVPKLQAMLKDRGRLVLTHLNWLPGEDETARQSEELVLKYNPRWKAAGYQGNISPQFGEALAVFRLTTFHIENVQLPFSREAWRGRIRACRGIGASLPAETVAEFDCAHAALLEKIAPAEFTVLHQIALHIFENRKA
jgi:2-polyprenyl-3-methyl-5-hydroxy-6-metoxy-1,4-benzoquinol methylase